MITAITLGMMMTIGCKKKGCKDINATNYDPQAQREGTCTYPSPIEDCTCGIIANDGITDGCHWLEIRNNCSGNKKQFCFDEDVWMNNYVGNEFCVSNVSEW